MVQLAQQVLLLRSLQTVKQEARSVTATDDITVLIVSIAETESCRQKLIEMCRLKFADFWRNTDRKRHIFEGRLQTCLVLVCAFVCWCILVCAGVWWCVVVCDVSSADIFKVLKIIQFWLINVHYCTSICTKNYVKIILKLIRLYSGVNRNRKYDQRTTHHTNHTPHTPHTHHTHTHTHLTSNYTHSHISQHFTTTTHHYIVSYHFNNSQL